MGAGLGDYIYKFLSTIHTTLMLSSLVLNFEKKKSKPENFFVRGEGEGSSRKSKKEHTSVNISCNSLRI